MKIKDLPKVDRPREKFLEKGADALSKSELLAILIGSGIKGKNVKQLSEQIIRKFGNKFLDIKIDDLLEVPGIGKSKALQIISALALVRRFHDELEPRDNVILSTEDAVSLASEIKNKQKEYLVCLYLNARNALLKKEIVSIGILDKSLVHPREIFGPAVELHAAGIILLHNHPSGDATPSKQDVEVINKILEAGKIMGVNVIDFIIVSEKNTHSTFIDVQTTDDKANLYVSDGVQKSLFDLLETERPVYEISAQRIKEDYFYIPQSKENYVQLHNRRYIGSKHKLIEWIFSILGKECERGGSFVDIFAGTGVVAAVAARHFDEIVLNDFLHSNYAIYQAFFGKGDWDREKIDNIVKDYNNINIYHLDDNYFSKNFGGKYFSKPSAKIIGFIRENIDENRANLTEKEYYILLASLLYSIDKAANTVGHYDAYFKKDHIEDGFFMRPIDPIEVKSVAIYREDANQLAKRINANIVYIDPPYNSRQYSRFYHVLETLTKWDKPQLFGTALKPTEENMSDYCRVSAKDRLRELVNDLKANYLAVSYNNTYDSKSNSSKNKITLQEIKNILSSKGKTKVFEKDYRHFNAGNTDFKNHKEYLFITKVGHE
jgi:adenine-specific DNA-methyltransferase